MKGIGRYLVLTTAGAAVFSSTTGELSAQTSATVDGTSLVRDAVPPSAASTAPAPAEAKPLVSDEAARVGAERSRRSEEVPASASQTTGGTTMKWVIIVALAVISALFILALADIGSI